MSINNKIGNMVKDFKFHGANHPGAIGVEGTDHINVSLRSVTKLGNFLALRKKTPFTHGELGEFASIEALWMYLSYEVNTPEEELIIRNIHGDRRYDIIKTLRKKNTPSFKRIVHEAIKAKILSEPLIAKQLAENTIPLKIYYTKVDGEKVSNVAEAWLLAMFDEIRDICISTKPWVTTEEEGYNGMVDDVSEDVTTDASEVMEVVETTPSILPDHLG
jgi:hypothetical protein